MRYFIATYMAFFACAEFVYADTIYRHDGNIDPELEGWTVIEPALAPSGRPVSGAITNDSGTGTDAWFIDDDLSTIGSSWLYTQTPTNLDHNNASSQGWVLRANLRLIDKPDDVSNAGAVMLEYANGVTDYRLALGTESDGDPVALLWDGGTAQDGLATGIFYALQGGGDGYHLYEMNYDPAVGSVDLWIDGVKRISDYSGYQTDLFDRIAWGSGSSFDTGHANWNSVEWSINSVPVSVPLPASLILLFSGLLGLGSIKKILG